MQVWRRISVHYLVLCTCQYICTSRALNDGCVTSRAVADAVEAASISPRSLAKQLNMSNSASLERNIKRELEQEGLLDGAGGGGGDDVTDDEDDEVLAELKKKQAELKALSAQNLQTARQLYKQAKEEMARQDTRTRLVAADAEASVRSSRGPNSNVYPQTLRSFTKPLLILCE